MIVLLRPDWKEVELIKGLRLGECVVSVKFPDLAAKIIPTESQIENAYRLATLFFQPVMRKFGPVIHHSWIRDIALNQAVGGVFNSGHLLGSADDFVCPRVSMKDVFSWVQAEMNWPGEFFFHKQNGGCHVDLPRIGINNDHGILDK